jgi:hypothetical protein
MRRPLALLAVPLVVLMAACGDDDDVAAPADPTPVSLVHDSEPPNSAGGSPEAIADLARRHGVDPATITLITDEDVTWRSGAIGCPDPEMVYTQALVPGTRIILELDGARYEYHSGGPRSIFLCEHPEPPVGE